MKTIFQRMISVQKAVTVFLSLLVTCLVVYQVFLRYVFKAPLMGIEEMLFFPTIWLYMIGGANASLLRNHIECGVLVVYVKKPKALSLVLAFKELLSTVICAWLVFWAYWFFVYSFNQWKLSDLLYIPMFIGESALFIGLLLMFVYAITSLADAVKAVRREFTLGLKGGA